ETEEKLMNAWLALLEAHNALLDESWFATDEKDQTRLREFRHQLPVRVNEWLTQHGQRKVSTDMAVPDEAFAGMLQFYQTTLRASGLRYVIFGHIGDNHVHVNILPRDNKEAAQARAIYGNSSNVLSASAAQSPPSTASANSNAITCARSTATKPCAKWPPSNAPSIRPASSVVVTSSTRNCCKAVRCQLSVVLLI
ncbi:MAG TPA: FAD-linked oxidase C-terminal domain-containing protein, partial [Pyrinomonadaceae bacterium]|nr:FAD-linked oxidase C-terminal domain-containing protein [Pyrinomonadaceae bacterium]